MQNGSAWYSSAVWISVDSRIQRRIYGEIIGGATADSFSVNRSYGHCCGSSDDSCCSSPPDRPTIGNPAVHPVEHHPVALEPISSGDEYLLGALSD